MTPAPAVPVFASRWTVGNAFELLENGEAYYPRVFDAIRSARHEVVIETFILFEDKVGMALHGVLLDAARRGVSVDLTVDGYGSPDLSDAFIAQLADAGVRLHVFDPAPRIAGYRTNWLRRMHRKIVVVDARVAFVGGINFSADHLADFGPEAKQDYAVQVSGPLVAEIHRYTRDALAASQHPDARRRWFSSPPARTQALVTEGAQGLLVVRDNHRHRTDIEWQYRLAIRSANQRVVIANAYFFPGYRFLRDLRRAARRGVRVALILQGQPDMPVVKIAAQMLYRLLVNAGVEIYEYCDRPLHGKVALVDGEWSTVGSSNLDPLSLALNLEANVFIRDAAFNHHLAARLEHLMQNCCQRVDVRQLGPSTLLGSLRTTLAYHAVRLYPQLAHWFPEHRAQLKPLAPLEPLVNASHTNPAPKGAPAP